MAQGRNVFDPELFGLMVKAAIEKRGKSLRQCANEADVDKSTMCRVSNGGEPSLETYLRLMLWIERP